MTPPSWPTCRPLLLRAMDHEPVPRVPVWLMRQAGRCDPAYRAYRERVGLDLYALFRAPEHGAALSLLPRRWGVDAIILYQDILTPLAPMGADFRFAPGPVLENPLRDAGQLRGLRRLDPADDLPFVGQEIALVRQELVGALPLLGFAGAPVTLAAFLIEGGSPATLTRTLALATEQPQAFQALLDTLTVMTVDYLNYQARCGVDAVQLFESVGDLLPRPFYERFAQPSHVRVFEGLQPGLPGILFVKGSPFPDLMLASGARVLSVGAGVSLAEVLHQGQGRVAVQGNVDNRLLATGTSAQVADAVRACLKQGGGRGHILNLNHGVLPETPFGNVLAMIQAAREVRFENAPSPS